MSAFPSSLTAISATPVTPGPEREKLAAASKRFEAIFVRHMLAAARKADFGGKELFGGEALATFRQMQDERFADLAAERGAFGLAKMIEARLARQIATESPSRKREGSLGRAISRTEAPDPCPPTSSPSPVAARRPPGSRST